MFNFSLDFDSELSHAPRKETLGATPGPVMERGLPSVIHVSSLGTLLSPVIGRSLFLLHLFLLSPLLQSESKGLLDGSSPKSGAPGPDQISKVSYLIT